MTRPATSSGAIAPSRHALEQFLSTYKAEHATTLKVLRAFPPEESEFRPHERSNSARMLAWTFVIEERMMLTAVRNQQVIGSGGGFPQPPDSWDAIIGMFEAQHEELVRELEQATEATGEGVVKFYTGPKQVGDYRTMDFLWFLLHDQIHHRGQLSVYVRMAGGRVPSIYGPTADEPWN